MQIFIEPTGSFEAFTELLRELAGQEDNKAFCIFTNDNNRYTPENLAPHLESISQPIFGGVFPGLVYKDMQMDKGSIILVPSCDVKVRKIQHMSCDNQDYERILEELTKDDPPPKTLMVLVDGLSSRISAFIDALYAVFGLDVSYFGGGAGSLSLKQGPCLFTNQGLEQDCALLIDLDIQSGVGVSHGWKSIKGPFKVTQAEQNRVISLDWMPAFSLYKSIVDEHSGGEITEDNFFTVAKSYPFGITRLNAEHIIRDPYRVGEDNSLVCVGEISEGAFLDIMHGDKDSLIDATKEAVRRSRENIHALPEVGLNFFIDCVSRVLFLGDRFDEELKAANTPGTPLIGVCSLGEIANNGIDYLEFYNKTSVLALLEDA